MSKVKEKGAEKAGANSAPSSEKSEAKNVNLELDYSKSYLVESLVNSGYLKLGKTYNVTGKLAEKMISNNQAKLKE